MKLALVVFLHLSLSACLAAADKARFDNYRVYSVAIETEEQLKVLREIEETSDSVSDGVKLRSQKLIKFLAIAVQLLGFTNESSINC
jgi:hypothetical protein